MAALVTALAGAYAGVSGVLRARSSRARADTAESQIAQDEDDVGDAIRRLETEVEALGRVADRALKRAMACEDREAETEAEMDAMRTRLDHLERLVKVRGRR